MLWQRYLLRSLLLRCAFVLAVPVQEKTTSVVINADATIDIGVLHASTVRREQHVGGTPILAQKELGVGECDGEISADFECKETQNKTKGQKLIKKGGTCTVACIGVQKGRIASPSSIKCKCQKDAAAKCQFKVAGLKCDSALATGCFPRTAQLLQPSGMQVSVASLQAGAQVVGLGSESEGSQLTSSVYHGDSHEGHSEARDGSLHAFLEIKHVCGGTRVLRVTAEHLVFVVDVSSGSRHLERAGSLRAGLHSLLALGCKASETSVGQSMVLSVEEVWTEGLYNPLTTSGTAIVDGVATSNCALVTPGISEAWQASPTIRMHGEKIAQAVLLLPRILNELGVPWAWLHSEKVQAAYTMAIDALFGLGAWAATP